MATLKDCEDGGNCNLNYKKITLNFMKLKSFLQWNLFVSSLVLLLENYFRKKGKMQFNKRTSYEIIMDIYTNFKKRQADPNNYKPPITLVEIIRIPYGEIKEKLDKSEQFLFAILNIKEGNQGNPYQLNIHFEPDSFDITKPGKLSKPPIGLDAFPFAIKMEKCNLLRLLRETTCKCFLFYPCIENGWKDANIPPAANKNIHFTIAVLGSEPDDCYTVNKGHTSEYKRGSIDGEETWPEENFVWYTESAKDFILTSQ